MGGRLLVSIGFVVSLGMIFTMAGKVDYMSLQPGRPTPTVSSNAKDSMNTTYKANKEHLAQKFGAHIYIDAKAQDAAAAVQKLGGADVILATAPSGAAIGSLLPGLKTRGKLAVVGVSGDAIPVNGVPLTFGGRSVVGSLTGRAIETQDTLDFSVLTDLRPMIKTLPLAKAEEAHKRMMDGKACFKVVLTKT